MHKKITDDEIAKVRDHAQRTKVSTDLSIKWDTVSIPNRPKGSLNSTIIQTSGTTSKIVFHIKDISKKDMESISMLLWGLVAQLNIDGSSAEGGVSPIFLHQWDFVLLDVPNFRVEAVCKYLVQQTLDSFRKT